MTQWGVLGVVSERDRIEINGIDLWEHKWRAVAVGTEKLPHPQYALQLHDFSVYEIEGNVRTIRFAAAELSAGVWGFYVPCASPEPSN